MTSNMKCQKRCKIWVSVINAINRTVYL